MKQKFKEINLILPVTIENEDTIDISDLELKLKTKKNYIIFYDGLNLCDNCMYEKNNFSYNKTIKIGKFEFNIKLKY